MTYPGRSLGSLAPLQRCSQNILQPHPTGLFFPLYNSVKTGSQLVLETRSWRQEVVEKASTQQKAGPLGLRLSNPERHNADGHKSGGQYIAVLFGLQLPLTVKPWVTLFEPFQIKWEYILLNDCVAYLHCLVVIIIVSLWFHIHMCLYSWSWWWLYNIRTI